MENDDGTYSIVNPETSEPYPGSVGMEKEKPYKCDHCGKRYKNLNGLKYHRQHNAPCNPELLQQMMQLGNVMTIPHQISAQMQGPGAPDYATGGYLNQ
jgi:transcription factor SFP1